MNATVTILQDSVTTHDAIPGFEATVVTIEQPIMRLTSRQPAERGVALRIDTPEAIWLGEVEKCSAEGDGYAIQVRLRHVLRDFETLARLSERFGVNAPKQAPETARETSGKTPKGTQVKV